MFLKPNRSLISLECVSLISYMNLCLLGIWTVCAVHFPNVHHNNRWFPTCMFCVWKVCITNVFHSNVGSSYAGGQWAAGDEPLYYVVSPKDVVIAKPRLISSSLSFCIFLHFIYAWKKMMINMS